MKHSAPRFRMRARLAAIKRRKKSVEITAGLSPEPNGFFFFRKRNPLEQREPRRPMPHAEGDESEERSAAPASSGVARVNTADEET